MSIKRIYVEKKPGFDVEAQGVFTDIKENLQIAGLTGLRIVNRYDVANLTDEEYQKARGLIFSEPPVDFAYDETLEIAEGDKVFAVEFLPGQYDQRADSTAQCIQILTEKDRPEVKTCKIYILQGEISDADFARIKDYCINPVEAHEAKMEKPENLDFHAEVPQDVKTVSGFIKMDGAALSAFAAHMGFAMDLDDLKFCQNYFAKEEGRDPSVTELRVIDTYWSDHCRHTTFSTVIEDVTFEEGIYKNQIEKTYQNYLDTRKALYVGKNKTICLMDIAVIAAKALKKAGKLDNLDESEEINACSIEVDVDVDGKTEKWLVMFKNETHNHPTEIEPFGGAATCLGGAIRDPLSGRSYVYQAMRVTGCADVRKPVAETMAGKLPQRKIGQTAAAGYSSYGNQIGLATGQVVEIYDEGYVAKHMEIGAVIGAAPKCNVVRERPAKGDVIILLGGDTGRDGCGGATGSSKAHTDSSIETCTAEVQKGNPLTERKIQRLFRSGEVTTLVKRCNDFGAGGVCVAIGELADGLSVDLDKVPKKYEGLDGTELAISESQERMAVVVDAGNVEKFIAFAHDENLKATPVAVVTDDDRLTMTWRDAEIVSLSREFLNTNGAPKYTKITVTQPQKRVFEAEKSVENVSKTWLDTLGSLNVCSQKGLAERFDSTIGAATVLMPYGGKYQNSPQEGMAAKLPVPGETTTCSLMSFGYFPEISKISPYHGAVYAVVSSVSKMVAMGADFRQIRLTFQEYFERLGTDEKRWGKPLAALLGAFYAQMGLGLAAIGGKDSMSGSFNDLDVPPTLVSFAVACENIKNVTSAELKKAGSKLILVDVPKDANDLPDFAALADIYDAVHNAILAGKVLSAATVKTGGLGAVVAQMAFGNQIGAKLTVSENELFAGRYGALVLETEEEIGLGRVIGETTEKESLVAAGAEIALADALAAWEKPLEKVYPTRAKESDKAPFDKVYEYKNIVSSKTHNPRPRVFIPVFPGTNCEYDTAKAFNRAGGEADVFVINNLTPADIAESLAEMTRRINQSQIIMLPGGFSGGDEPDGSGKFIATAFRNPNVKEATMNLLKNRDGLMLGICNGFQALVKLGLVPTGEICDLTADSPTLTYNTIGRHISRMVYTRVSSNLSPWFAGVKAGDIHAIAVSHGEGRFVANDSVLQKLYENGQIATQYVDINGAPTGDIRYNPNGSFAAIEGITSPDGRVLGKMGHSERLAGGVFKNILGEKDQKLFQSGVNYFK